MGEPLGSAPGKSYERNLQEPPVSPRDPPNQAEYHLIDFYSILLVMSVSDPLTLAVVAGAIVSTNTSAGETFYKIMADCVSITGVCVVLAFINH